MSCLCTKYRKPSKNTLENTTIPIANVGEFFLDKHIYVDSFLHGHIKIVGHLQVTLKIAITDENILFFLKSLCILSEEASRQDFFICLLAFVLREVLAYLCNPGRPSTHSNPPSAEITACLTTASFILFLKTKSNQFRQSPWTSQVAETPSPTSSYVPQTKPKCTSFWLLKCDTLSSISSWVC